ncbi:hypothetical protein RAA17_19125 [Komagataeibacter rhaeticus]|nr:hypothetical protein [Komagataeibacter rhaeticus]
MPVDDRPRDLPYMRRPTDSNDRPSRLSIFLRRQKRLLRPLLVLVAVVALGAGGMTALRHVGSDERFAALRARIINMLPLRITEIDVTGCVLTSQAALQQALGVRTGISSWAFPSPPRANALMRCPLSTIPWWSGTCRAPSSSTCSNAAPLPYGRTTVTSC